MCDVREKKLRDELEDDSCRNEKTSKFEEFKAEILLTLHRRCLRLFSHPHRDLFEYRRHRG